MDTFDYDLNDVNKDRLTDLPVCISMLTQLFRSRKKLYTMLKICRHEVDSILYDTVQMKDVNTLFSFAMPMLSMKHCLLKIHQTSDKRLCNIARSSLFA